MIARLLGFAVLIALASPPRSRAADAMRPSPLRSGIELASGDIRALQSDDFANPGMLWVARGEKLWSAPPRPGGKTCADCHGDALGAMKAVATRYPALDRASGRLVDLEGRINLCRSRHQGTDPHAFESDELLAITAFVAHSARGMPVAAPDDPALQPYLERGRSRYFQRSGQMNLACTHCHDRNWGRALLAQTISQGHGNAYPAYRLEWQSLGSLQRRLRACYFGVRAEMPAYGSQELVELELYLAWRASGLHVETPGVRR